MDYLFLKWVHIISSTILFGTGIGSAFYMFMANRSRNVSAIYFAVRNVVVADFIFTTPSVVIQLVTGILLVKSAGYNLLDGWVLMALSLYFLAGICWLPVVWIQIKMRDMAKIALNNNTALPDHYWMLEKQWVILGSVAFPIVIIIFWLMVYKPVF